MEQIKLLADISRAFFRYKSVYSFRMQKVDDMSDNDVIKYCHWFCEDNGLVEEFIDFRTKTEAEYFFCTYLQEFIAPGCCYDMQMFAEGFINHSNEHKPQANGEDLRKHCPNCRYSL